LAGGRRLVGAAVVSEERYPRVMKTML